MEINGNGFLEEYEFKKKLMKDNINTILETDHFAIDTKELKGEYDPNLFTQEHLKQEEKYIEQALADYETTKELDLTEEQVNRLKSIQRRYHSHMLLNQRDRSDSEEMKDVKYYVKEVERLLDIHKNDHFSDELYDKLDAAYQTAVFSCKAYLDDPGKSENARKKAVRETWRALSFEADRLRNTLASKGKTNAFYGLTVADVFALDKNSVSIYKNEEQLNKNKTVKERPMSSDAKTVKGYFSSKFDPSAELKKIGNAKDKKKAAAKYMALRDLLRSFEPNTTIVREVEFMGKKVRLLQKNDNSLSILEGRTEYPLDFSAELLADKMDLDIATHGEEYGKENVKKVFEGLDPANENVSAGEMERIKKLCQEYLKSATNMPTHTFYNLDNFILIRFAKELSSGKKTVDRLLNEFRDFTSLDSEMINSSEVNERRKKVSAKSINKVTIDFETEEDFEEEILDQKEEVKEENKGIMGFFSNLFSFKPEEKKEEPKKKERAKKKANPHAKKWTKDEKGMLNFFADIIYDEQTWVTDEATQDNIRKEDNIRKLVGRHSGTIAAILKTPEILENFIQKLPLPNIELEKGKNAKDVLKEGVGDFLKEGSEFKEMIDAFENIPQFAVATALNQVAAYKVLPKTIKFGSTEMETKPLMEMLTKIAGSLDKYTETFMNNLQDSVSKQAAEIFGEDEEEDDVETAVMADNLIKTGVEELQQMTEDLVKGKKGVGKFNKLILNNYFKSVSMMDKRCMIGSMIRGLVPAGSVEKSDLEWIAELGEEPKYSGKFKNPGALTEEEKNILEEEKEKRMAAGLAGNMLGGVLKGSGPLMQKTMQGLPVNSLSKELRTALKDMKSNLSPIPKEIVETELATLIERSKGMITSIDVDKSLGAASVGQAFLCTMYGKNLPKNGKKVVIKMLRPDVKNRMMREKNIMLKCAAETDKSGGMLATYKGQLAGIEKELDLSIEAENVKKGSIYDGKHPDVCSMKLNDIIDPTNTCMVAELADGTTVDKYLDEVDAKIEKLKDKFYEKTKDENGKEVVLKRLRLSSTNYKDIAATKEELKKEVERLAKRRDHVCNLCDLWVKEGMTKSGFYHADLHAGNIMVDDDKVTVIDFGNAVQLTENQQKWIIAMLTAAMAGDVDLFTDSFEQLLEKKDDEEFKKYYNKMKKDQIKSAFTEILRKGDVENTGDRIMVALLKAQELGVEVPSTVYNFSQGQMRLMNTVNDMNARIKDMTETYNSLDKLYALNGETTSDPLLWAKHSLRNSRDFDKDFNSIIESLDRKQNDGMLDELKDTTKKRATKKAPAVDKVAEFEKKYLGDYTRIEADLTVSKGKLFDFKKAAQLLRDYINQFKDKKGTQEQTNYAYQLLGEGILMSSFSTGGLKCFGGATILQEIMDAVPSFNVEKIEKYIDLYENKIPKALEMMSKYKTLRTMQKEGKDITAISSEFMTHYNELVANVADQNNSNPLLAAVRSNLDYTKFRSADMIAIGNSDNQAMIRIKKDGLGEKIKAAYDENMKYFYMSKNKGGEFTEEDKAKYGTLENALTESKRKFSELYSKGAGIIMRQSMDEELKDVFEMEGIGPKVKEGYDDYRTVQDLMEEGKSIPKELADKYGIEDENDYKEAKKKVGDAFIEDFRQASLTKIKNFRDTQMGDGKELTVKENSFLTVMRDIVSDPFLVGKMAWKVGGKVGLRIAFSGKSASKQAERDKKADKGKPFKNFGIDPDLFGKVNKDRDLFAFMQQRATGKYERKGTEYIKDQLINARVNVKNQSGTIEIRGLGVSRMVIPLRGYLGEGYSNKRIVDMMDLLYPDTKERDAEGIAYRDRRFDEGMLELKDMYYNQLKRIEATYGTMISQIHPEDFMRQLPDDFADQFLILQDCQQLMTDGAKYFDYEKNEKDRHFKALSNYYNRFYTFAMTQYTMLINPMNMGKAGDLDEINKEGLEKTYQKAPEGLEDGIEENIRGPRLSEKELEEYRKNLKIRAKKEGWSDKLFGKFASAEVSEEDLKDKVKTEEIRKEYYIGETDVITKHKNAETLKKNVMAERDKKADFRLNCPIEIKCKCGYENTKLLSQFVSIIKWDDLDKYGKEDGTEGRFEVMDKLTAKILSYDLANLDIWSDETITKQVSFLENLSAEIDAYRKLLEKSPEYLKKIKKEKDDFGMNRAKVLEDQIRHLSAVSDYYKIQKMLMEDPEYIETKDKVNIEIGEKDCASSERFKEMLRLSEILKERARLVFGLRPSKALKPGRGENARTQAVSDKLDMLFKKEAKDPKNAKKTIIVDKKPEEIQKSIDRELEELRVRGYAVTDMAMRHSLRMDGKRNDQPNKIAASYAVAGTKIQDFQVGKSNSDAKRPGLWDKIDKMRKTYYSGNLNDPKYHGSADYPELATLDVFDNMNRMLGKLCSKVGEKMSDNEILELVRGLTIQHTKMYTEYKDKDVPGIKDYFEEEYAEKAMESLLIHDGLHKQCIESLGMEFFLTHPADLLFKLNEDQLELMTNIMTISNIICPSNETTLKSFIKKYREKNPDKMCIEDENEFYAQDCAYAGAWQKLQIFSSMQNYLSDPEDMKESEPYKYEYYKEAIGDDIKYSEIKEFHKAHANDKQYRELLSTIMGDRSIENMDNIEDKYLLAAYFYFNPEKITDKTMGAPDTDDLWVLMECQKDSEILPMLSSGNVNLLSVKEIKAYEKDMIKRGRDKLYYTQSQTSSATKVKSDPYKLGMFYRAIVGAMDKKEASGKTLSAQEIKERDAAKEELRKIRELERKYQEGEFKPKPVKKPARGGAPKAPAGNGVPQAPAGNGAPQDPAGNQG